MPDVALALHELDVVALPATGQVQRGHPVDTGRVDSGAGQQQGRDEPGWLVLVPRRHVLSIANLTDAEAAGLGYWQVRLSRALHAVTGCVRTYVVQFAEAEGFGHVHFHVVPRPVDLPVDRRGAERVRVPRAAGRPGGER